MNHTGIVPESNIIVNTIPALPGFFECIAVSTGAVYNEKNMSLMQG